MIGVLGNFPGGLIYELTLHLIFSRKNLSLFGNQIVFDYTQLGKPINLVSLTSFY